MAACQLATVTRRLPVAVIEIIVDGRSDGGAPTIGLPARAELASSPIIRPRVA